MIMPYLSTVTGRDRKEQVAGQKRAISGSHIDLTFLPVLILTSCTNLSKLISWSLSFFNPREDISFNISFNKIM